MEATTSSIQAPTWITDDNSPPLHHSTTLIINIYLTSTLQWNIYVNAYHLFYVFLFIFLRPTFVHSYLNPLVVSLHLLFLCFSHARKFLCILFFLLVGFNLIQIFITNLFRSLFHSQRYLPFLPSLLSLHTLLVSYRIMSFFIVFLFSLQSLQIIKFKIVPHNLQSNMNPFSHCYVYLSIHTLFITVRTPKLSRSMDLFNIIE